MNLDVIRHAYEARIKSTWTETPVAWENTIYKPVEGEAFIEPSLVVADGYKASLSKTGALNRFEGFLNINIYVPVNTGTAEAYKIASKVVDIFYSYDIGGIYFETGYPAPSGQQGNWYRLTVTIPFVYNEVQ
jgi:hypothetical protein